MKRPYVRPEVSKPAHDGILLPAETIAEFVAQAKTSRLAFRRHQYETEASYHVGSGFPSWDDWIAAKEAGPLSCLQCGCDGQSGSYH